MINVQNPPGSLKSAGQLSLGENRVYFGLWALMKAPLLLSARLPDLIPELLAIINNTEVIAINQDRAGVQARKLAINGQPMPWLVGLAPCDSAPKRSFARGFHTTARTAAAAALAAAAVGNPGSTSANAAAATSEDNREWQVLPLPSLPLHSGANASARTTDSYYQLKSLSTGRCLSAAGGGSPVLLPCDATHTAQAWGFGKGIHSPSSIYSAADGNQALAVDPATLFSATHKYKGGNDPFPVPSAAYGATTLKMAKRLDQNGCSRRGCENYDSTQMWFFDPVESLLRLSTYTASLNHADHGGAGLSGGGTGYLTPKTPTYQHHCLAHVLSNADQGSATGDTEVWGGPLAGGDFVLAALNRADGNGTASIALDWTMLGVGGVTTATRFDVRDLWAGRVLLRGQAGGFVANVSRHDIAIYRLIPSA